MKGQTLDCARLFSSRFAVRVMCCIALLGAIQAGVHATTPDGDANVIGANQAPSLTNPGNQTTSAVAGYAQVVLADGPAAYWRLGETGGASAADSAGTNAGTVVGGVALGQAGALVDGNAAMLFNGATGYVQVANSAAVQLAGDLTIELWVKSSLATRQTLISKSYLQEFELTLETSGRLNLYQGTGTTYQGVPSPVGVVVANTWQHVVVTRTANTIRFYVNGVAKGSGTLTLTPTVGTSAVAIGRTTGGTQYVNGDLDEVALYPIALSAAQIAAHYALQTSTNNPLVALPLAGSDPDGDALTYSAVGLPGGLTVTAATGLIAGTLVPASAGTYPVTVTVSDGHLSASQTFTWTVTGANQAPSLTNPGNQTTSAVAGYAQVVLADGPAAYWRLGETGGASAADSAGTNAGTVVGGVALGQAGALVDGNAAMLFNGATGYVQVANSAAVQLAGDLTIELWVKSSLATRQTLISKSYLQEFELTLETSGRLNLYQGTGATYQGVPSPVGVVVANTWQHVVVTRTANTIRFYVNGVAKGSGTLTLTPTVGTSAVAIGRTTGGTQYVNGDLDEVALYPIALSAAQIAAHYALQTSTNNPLVALPLAGSDPDGDALTYSAVGLPGGLTVTAATGLIAGTLVPASAGTYPVTVTVSDGHLSASQTFTWTVTGANQAPSLTNPGNQTTSAVTGYAQVVLADGPAAYWRLGETGGASAADSAGTNTGTVVGGVALGQAGALVDGNAAMLFNGATGYVQVANSAAVQLAGDLTIELWVNASLAARQTLISKSYLHEFELTLETDGRLNLYQGNGATYQGVQSPVGSVTGNTWQHVVVTRTGATNTIRFYVNGIVIGSGSFSLTPTVATGAVSIGRTTIGTQYVNGYLDEVALYPVRAERSAYRGALRAADIGRRPDDRCSSTRGVGSGQHWPRFQRDGIAGWTDGGCGDRAHRRYLIGSQRRHSPGGRDRLRRQSLCQPDVHVDGHEHQSSTGSELVQEIRQALKTPPLHCNLRAAIRTAMR